MVDIPGIGNIGNAGLGFVGTGLFWFSLILGMGFLIWISLWIRKQRKLKYNLMEVIDIGNDKIAIRKGKAGWFGKRTILFGLLDVGTEKVLMHKDKRIIEQVSTEDLHDIGGSRGFIVMRKSDDPKILVPLTKFRLTERSRALIGAIAPADFRDASDNIISMAKSETLGTWDRILPYLALGAIVLFFIIAVIFASQTFNKSIDTAKDLLLKAGDKLLEASASGHAVAGGSP